MLRKIAKHVLKLSNAIAYDINRKYIHQYFPVKPLGINMNANDICNSKCTMCNIWQQKQGFEMSPNDLKEALNNPLFSEIKYVGITGGEPTLRNDLPSLYKACIDSLPKLTHLSIITNAIKHKEVIQRIEEVAEMSQKNGKHFSMMVSLDGLGDVHDEVRGREGNFESALHVLEYFKKKNAFPVTFGCTISKANVWEIDDLLYYVRQRGWEGRFRIAEFINRLYNNDREGVIRNFDEEEKYHLACFYHKLISIESKNEAAVRNYQSNISLLTGGKRTMACPHHSQAVQLDSRGNLHYCAPKSGKIVDIIKDSALEGFKSGLSERRRLLEEECNDCIHDYRDQITSAELFAQYKLIFYSLVFHRISAIKYLSQVNFLSKLRTFKRDRSKKMILVTGWYGTETIGDKAILGGIYNYYKKLYGDIDFAVTSIHPFITHKTLNELKIEGKVVDTLSSELAVYSTNADEVVIGGGPLMDLEILSLPLWVFKLAKKNGIKTTIFGCGLGPLHNPVYNKTVKELLFLADEIKLRDSGSVKLAIQWTGRQDIVNSGCPAKGYITSQSNEILVKERKAELACFLRSWDPAYKEDISAEEFNDYKEKFEKGLAEYIKTLCFKFSMVPAFYPMHTFHLGGDDREFYRTFTEKYFKDENYYLHKKNADVDFIIKKMKASKMNLCMRFHSVLFAESLNTDFRAVDYTRGGKITGYLKDSNQLNRLISMDELIIESKELAVSSEK